MPDVAPHANPRLEHQVLGQILGYAGVWDLYAAVGQFVVNELANLRGRRAVLDALEKGTLSDIVAHVDAVQLRTAGASRTYDATGQLDSIRADVERDRAGRLWLGFGRTLKAWQTRCARICKRVAIHESGIRCQRVTSTGSLAPRRRSGFRC
jgi:hypothetical protein